MVKQYVGARYVPKFASPVEWAADTSYEALTIVTFNNASYTSKIQVPPTVGNPANNPKYWALTGNYNAQVEQYRQETENYNAQVEEYRQETVKLEDHTNKIEDSLNSLCLQVINYNDKEDITSKLTSALNRGSVLLIGTGTPQISSMITVPNNAAIHGNNATIKCSDSFSDSYAITLGTERTAEYYANKTEIKDLTVDCNSKCNGITCVQGHANILNVKIKDTQINGIGITVGTGGNTKIINCQVTSALNKFNTGIDIPNSGDGIIDNFVTFGTKIGIHQHSHGGGYIINNIHVLAYNSDIQNSDWENSIGVFLEGPNCQLSNIYCDNFRTGIKASSSFNCCNLFCYCWEYNNKVNRYALDLTKDTGSFNVENATVDNNNLYYYINPSNTFYLQTANKRRFTFSYYDNLHFDDPACLIQLNHITNYAIDAVKTDERPIIAINAVSINGRNSDASVTIINNKFIIKNLILHLSYGDGWIQVLDYGEFKPLTNGINITLRIRFLNNMAFVTLQSNLEVGTISVLNTGLALVRHNSTMPAGEYTAQVTKIYS